MTWGLWVTWRNEQTSANCRTYWTHDAPHVSHDRLSNYVGISNIYAVSVLHFIDVLLSVILLLLHTILPRHCACCRQTSTYALHSLIASVWLLARIRAHAIICVINFTLHDAELQTAADVHLRKAIHNSTPVCSVTLGLPWRSLSPQLWVHLWCNPGWTMPTPLCMECQLLTCTNYSLPNILLLVWFCLLFAICQQVSDLVTSTGFLFTTEYSSKSLHLPIRP